MPLLSPQELRKFLHAEPPKPAAEVDRLGAEFLQAKQYPQALFCFEKTKNAAHLRAIRDAAAKEGDAFLLQWIDRIDPSIVTADDWRSAARVAEQGGRLRFAEQAFAKAGDAAHAARIHAILVPPPPVAPRP